MLHGKEKRWKLFDKRINRTHEIRAPVCNPVLGNYYTKKN